MARLPLLFLLALVPACAGGASVEPTPHLSNEAHEAPAAPVPLDAALFERVAIVGASMSAGFNLQLEVGVDTRLADFLAEALQVDHELVADGATELLFLDTATMGEAMVAEALAAAVGLAVAVQLAHGLLRRPRRFVFGNKPVDMGVQGAQVLAYLVELGLLGGGEIALFGFTPVHDLAGLGHTQCFLFKQRF